MMVIKIAGLGEGVHNYSFDEKVEEIGLSAPFFGSFHVDVKLTKSHNQLVLDAGLELNAKFDCDMCTAAFDTKINTEYQMVYFFGKEPAGNDDLNITYLPADTDKINLTAELRDYSLLAIPMKKLCREDCKGLCPVCGKDFNEGECGCVNNEMDARWLPLQELKNKLNNN